MKKLFTTALMALSLAACSSNLTVENTKYESYGLLSPSKEDKKVCYKANTGDVILGVLFIETVIAPIYIFGFDVFEPVAMKDAAGNCK